MVDELINKKRCEFLGASGQVLSGVIVAGSAMATPHDTGSAQASAVKEPAVIGYPNTKGLTIERVTYPARNMGTTIIANLF